MSKNKIGDIKFDEYAVKGCVLNEYATRNRVYVTRNKNDPGAVYVIISTHTDWYATLRGVYKADKARNVPKPGKPTVSGFDIKVGSDRMHVVVGNYNIDGDIKSTDASDHEMIDDIMLIMSTMDEPRNVHDADGFIRLSSTGRGYRYQRDSSDPEDDGSGQTYDTDITVDNVYKSNDDIINLVNAIAMFANRANILYRGYGGYYREDELDVSLGRVVLPQKVMTDIAETMDKHGMMSCITDQFVNSIIYGLTLESVDRKTVTSRLNYRRRFAKFNPTPVM